MGDISDACERTAHVEGLAAGLELALREADVTTPPGPVAAVPTSRVPAGATTVPHALAAGEGISFLRYPSHVLVDTACTLRFGRLLAAVRLGTTRRLTEHAVRHLGGRTVGGDPTLGKQLVQGTLADLITETEVLRHRLAAPGDDIADLADVQDRLTALDWEATKLLGASGYVGGGQATTAYVSRLVANCWTLREGHR
ncbi:acyl-CoA dehydrogenase family protein [Streptomyces sp. TBY4]|uniref:acyl-CoA dehydrogenase family protein n=1 Tax=Streptomyces sp. TBY4 TaxID=2962030 RepID=UPI0020B81E03|nr:acyl-CoA dehydrogenase family protein [Streptomyces sp. TBY4]MCP3760522.1 acyl-CoA dehydrogenase family protein [Streptomyces sp. TBY4]